MSGQAQDAERVEERDVHMVQFVFDSEISSARRKTMGSGHIWVW